MQEQYNSVVMLVNISSIVKHIWQLELEVDLAQRVGGPFFVSGGCMELVCQATLLRLDEDKWAANKYNKRN